jgi:dihydroorotase/N-acyl-D-amino-acid deacylase
MSPGKLAAILFGFACLIRPALAQQYDLIIRNGHIIDGTGSPWYSGDIAIQSGHIAAIGPLPRASAKQTIDAHGLTVAPGFIDMLGQSERTILVNPHLPSKIFQGITTEITGEGNSVAPTNDRLNALNQPTNQRLGITPDWHSLADYFSRIERRGMGINLASFMGATTARRIVIGDDDRAPTPAELARMQGLVLDAMHQGAVGLSTALQYSPAPYATTDELIALASTAASAGGIYATHMRSEGDQIDAALDETFRISREAKIPAVIWHLKISGKDNWGKIPEIVARIDAARASGLDISANTYAYTAASNSFSAFIPPWAHDGGNAAMVARIHDPAQHARIRDSIEHDRGWNNEWLQVEGPASFILTSTNNPDLQPLLGKSLAEIATTQHKDPIDCALDLIAADPALSIAMFVMSEPDVADVLKQPWVSVDNDNAGTAIDGVLGQDHPHPRAYGTFPHILRKYVREDHLLTLPDAIRKFSALPAQTMHLADRGVLKAGMWADIVIFDPDKVADLATYANPNQYSVGMSYVLVNGIPVIANGKMTQALPGKVLRGPGYVP